MDHASNEVSTPRLYVLRAAYLLMAAGLAVMVGPLLVDPPADLAHPRGVMWSLLGGVGLLALLGIRYPLRMLPLLLFELVWKAVWLGAIWLPKWRAGTLGPAERQSFVDCVFGVLLILVVIPWPYVIRHFVRRPGDPWHTMGSLGASDRRRIGSCGGTGPGSRAVVHCTYETDHRE